MLCLLWEVFCFQQMKSAVLEGVGVVDIIAVATIKEQMLGGLNVKYMVKVSRGTENIRVLSEVLLKA